MIKADTIGSLEALIKESRDKNIKIRKAEIGNVSKRDIVEAKATKDVLNRVIFAFNVKLLPEAKDELLNSDLMIFNEDVIYTIMENYDEWIEKKKSELELKRKKDFIHPGMIKILPEFIFRISNPAIIGVRILTGRIKNDIKLMNENGNFVGKIKGIQSENQSVDEAIQGEEVAISIDGVTVGRQIKKDEILYTDIPEKDAKILKEMNILNIDEKDLLIKIFDIKRKNEKFWGM
jgi:translation initiation factor 5B